jgi:hypothetical protein
MAGRAGMAVDHGPGDRPLDQGEELAGEDFRVGRAGRAGQVLEELAEGLTVPDQDGVGGRPAAVRWGGHRRRDRRAGELL